MECPTGVDDLLTVAFAKGYIYSGESRSHQLHIKIRVGTGYYSKTLVIDHM